MVTLIRIAHSSALIDFDGSKILTDPWFSERFGYHRGEPYGITLENLPRLTEVVVSHGHYDHYDMKSFRAYSREAGAYGSQAWNWRDGTRQWVHECN